MGVPAKWNKCWQNCGSEHQNSLQSEMGANKGKKGAGVCEMLQAAIWHSIIHRYYLPGGHTDVGFSFTKRADARHTRFRVLEWE
jgi:hypothetical protein